MRLAVCLILGFLVSCSRREIVLRNVPAAPATHADSPVEAAEYFLEQRVAGAGPLPLERYRAAMAHTRTMRRLPHDIGGTGTWEFLGPGNVGGRSRGIVVHPQDPNTIWIGGATGGVWKTTDGGQNWTPTTDFLPALSINSLAMDPSDANTLYAGTGEQTQNWRGAGIYKTTDGGQSWTQLPATTTADFWFVNNVAIGKTAPSHLYAATSTGIWASVDGGTSWSLSLSASDGGPAPTLTGGTTHGCFDVLALASQPADTVLAVCHPPGSLQYAIYRNADASGSGGWEMVYSDPQMWYTALAEAPSEPSTVYAVSVTSDATGSYAKALLGVYRSQGGGAAGTWIARTSNRSSNRLNTAILSIDSAYSFGRGFCTGSAPNLSGQAGYNLAVAVDPLDANRVWVAGVGLFRSDDGGANWGYASQGAHPDQHGLAFPPDYDGAANQRLYALNDGGIYKTDQARGVAGTCAAPQSAVTWTPLNNGYGATQFYHGSTYPGGAAYAGGTQDNGTVRGADARGPNQWDTIYGGDGGVSRLDPLNSSTVYVEYVHGQLAKSIDGGNTWHSATSGLDEDAANFPFVAAYVFDPANSLRLYLGGTRLWRSDDGAANWTPVSVGVDQPASGVDNIRSIAVSPADPNLVVFGTSGGRIFRNDRALAADGNTAWTAVQPRAGNVSHLEFDPRHPATVYASYTTFNSAAGDQHIYRSTDGGVTFAGIDGSGATGLPDVPVQTLLVDPDDSARLYAGTDVGLFASFDGGAAWTHDANPLANVIVMALAIERNAGTKYLYAFTYGRGVWRLALAGAGAAAACQYAVSPAAIQADAAGGVFAVDVSTAPDCAWSVLPAVSTGSTFASAQGPAHGSGAGKAWISIAPNDSAGQRQATLLVQNAPLTVTQAAAVPGALGDEWTTAPAVAVPGEIVATNNALTAAASDPRHFCTGSAGFRTGWLRFTAPADGQMQISVESIRTDLPSGNSGVAIGVYSLGAGEIGGELGCAAVLKDAGPVRAAVLNIPVTRGADYVVEIASLSTGAASDLARVFVALGAPVPKPLLDLSPPESTVAPGQQRRLSLVGVNLPNSAVRWILSPQIGSIGPDGTYSAPAGATGAVSVTAQSLADPTLRAVGTIDVQAPPASALPAPAVANGASYETGVVAPGLVVVIFGGSIGPPSLATAQLNAQGRLASSLGGTQVLFDGILAPLVYAGAQQVAAIVPYEVAGHATTQMVLVHEGVATAPVTLAVAPTAPALFTADGSGSGQAAAINQNGKLNSAQYPAPPGSVVSLFATGEGQTDPPGINGRIAVDALPKPAAPVRVEIGGLPAEVTYFGAAPQAVAGLFQVNVRIPAAARAGANPVLMTVGQVSTRTGVTIMVGN